MWNRRVRAEHKAEPDWLWPLIAGAALVLGMLSPTIFGMFSKPALHWSKVGTPEFAEAARHHEPMSLSRTNAFHNEVAHRLALIWASARLPSSEQITIVCGEPYAAAGVPCFVVQGDEQSDITCHGYPPPLDGGRCWRK